MCLDVYHRLEKHRRKIFPGTGRRRSQKREGEGSPNSCLEGTELLPADRITDSCGDFREFGRGGEENWN
ncbi:MAG: hypothetical protein C6P37_09350 [Caldibacillus debilis]|uniref:Uncharacterized protein n=1 Tax=Caldibacillus debilis TaxID=301148 RepID=A0A3E0K3Y1_9BACI|nr:hypothetical protein [Bacillaceae bacterium]OUM87512.1 MAG: hypothetical protein BAA03_13280 [Caldibacillus debilis]REJ15057.1 MAG: hypothetical protein C6W57_12065 [Caldibacillus debilis]REJ28044.1 MAG: hypothetical protein C6P37_09350 [Caldibacillus debilis]